MPEASTDLHGGYYSDAIIAQFTGKGTGACYNPAKILQALRQLVSCQTAEEYSELITRAESLKIQVVRNAELGGYEAVAGAA